MKKTGKLSQMILVLAVMLFCLTACGEQKQDMSANDGGTETAAVSEEESQGAAEESPKQDESVSGSESDMENNDINDDAGSGADNGEEHKVLVAYFSATGTTKKLAEYAAQVTGADLYEIVPEEPYTDADLNYNDKNSRTSIEMNDASVKPAISGSVSDMAQYDIVFIAYPIWWGVAPHIMDTFMESYDFSGKTIVPFCTSGSSGIGSSAKNLHSYTDDTVTWLDGARLKSSLSKEDMADWINGLSLGIEVK